MRNILLGFLLTVIVYAALASAVLVPLALWTGRTLDFWLTHFKGHPIHVPFFLDLLACLFAPFMLLANVVSEIARLCI